MNRLFVLFLLCLAPAAQAYDRQDMMQATGLLKEQLLKINKLGDRSCPGNYRNFDTGHELRISIFYGYENYQDITADMLHADAMVKALQFKCFGNIEACGFKLVARTPNVATLSGEVRGRAVKISIHNTSVTELDKNNSNFGHDQWAQYAQSQIAWRDFHRALQKSDVVFYAGHSRLGAGLGFNIESFGQDAFNYVFKMPLRATVDVLRKRPSRLKLLGLFSCSSDQYYREAMQGANPNIDMIVSHKEISGAQGEQMSIGSINAVLAQKCAGDVRKSLDAVVKPAPGLMEWKKSLR